MTNENLIQQRWDESFRTVLYKEKEDEYSFLVTLAPCPPLPPGLKTMETFTGFSVVAMNDTDGNKEYGGMHLHEEEKQFIGYSLTGAKVPVNTWVWCNLFTQE